MCVFDLNFELDNEGYAWKFASALFKCHEMENVAMEEGEDAVGGGWMGRKPITAS